jgi:hypothetical protein
VVDINGKHHYVAFTNITGNCPARRFCGDCGKLRKCFVWAGEVRCLECSKGAGVVTLIDARFSAITRSDEHRRFTLLAHKNRGRARKGSRSPVPNAFVYRCLIEGGNRSTTLDEILVLHVKEGIGKAVTMNPRFVVPNQ